MFKKKFFFVVLCTLLLTLLLGLCGSCYAVSSSFACSKINEMTTQNTATTWNNYVKAMNYWTTHYNYQLDVLDTYFENYNCFSVSSLVEYVNPNQAQTQLYYANNMWFVFFNLPNGAKLYTSNNKLYCNQAIDYVSVRLSTNSNGGTANVPAVTTTTYTNKNELSTSRIDRGCVFTSDTIYNSSGLTTPNTTVNSGLNTGVSTSQIVWQFTPAGNNTTIYGGNQWNYHAVNAGWSTYLGSITDSEWVSKIKYRVAYYDTSLKKYSDYGNYITIYDYNLDGNIWDIFSGSTSNNNGVYTTGIYLKTNNLQNNLLQLVIESGVPDTLTTIYTDYILENTYTYIEGGVFYPNLTFSGDYNNDYNQQQQNNIIQENHDDTINTITDDSQVDGLIDDFLNSGDLLNSIGGYNYFENPFIAFVEDLADSFVDVLTGSNNQSITINWRGTNYTFYATDFALPSGTLKTFISAICNAFFVWGLIKYGYQLYEWIRTGRVQNWLNNTSSGNIEDYFLF